MRKSFFLALALLAGSVGFGKPAKAQSDNFNNNFQDAQWVFGSGRNSANSDDFNVPTLEQNHQLEIHLLDSVDGLHYNGYKSASPQNLAGKCISVELVSAPAAALDDSWGAEVALAVYLTETDPSSTATIVLAGGYLFVYYTDNGNYQTPSLPWKMFSAVDDRYWRVCNDLDWTFETSADGSSWIEIPDSRVSLTWSRSAIKTSLSAGTGYAVSAPGIAIFDNLKVE
jgi:hypothetical protein